MRTLSVDVRFVRRLLKFIPAECELFRRLKCHTVELVETPCQYLVIKKWPWKYQVMVLTLYRLPQRPASFYTVNASFSSMRNIPLMSSVFIESTTVVPMAADQFQDRISSRSAAVALSHFGQRQVQDSEVWTVQAFHS